MRLKNIMPNFNEVQIGQAIYYFSYETLVAFNTPGSGLVVSENQWTRTTGKHLNYLCEDKKERVSAEEFKKLADSYLEN